MNVDEEEHDKLMTRLFNDTDETLVNALRDFCAERRAKIPVLVASVATLLAAIIKEHARGESEACAVMMGYSDFAHTMIHSMYTTDRTDTRH